MNILGIETSCDETAAALVQDGKTVLSTVVATSTEMHRKYGGIVPEVAARKQVESMIQVLREALQIDSKQTIQQLNNTTINSIDAIAVTVGPGLIGSLLVGVETAKTLAVAWNKPIIPVNHVLAHMYANFVEPVIPTEVEGSHLKASNEKDSSTSPPAGGSARNDKIVFPAISLVVSGGHTELYLMTDAKTLKWLGGTTDDAAGEAFDKSARLLGFENRGGVAIEQAAKKYKVRHSGEERSDDSRIDSGRASLARMTLPRPLLYDKTLNFSFSGLKTAVMREWKKYSSDFPLSPKPFPLVNIFAHEVQEAITDVLVAKTLNAARQYNAKSILVSGGVAANKRLNQKFAVGGSQFAVFFPPKELCTDNAVTIAACAFYQNNPVPWKEITAQPDLVVEV